MYNNQTVLQLLSVSGYGYICFFYKWIQSKLCQIHEFHQISGQIFVSSYCTTDVIIIGRLMRIHRTVCRMLMLMEFFTRREWAWSVDNVCHLRDQLSPNDRQVSCIFDNKIRCFLVTFIGLFMLIDSAYAVLNDSMVKHS